MGGVNRYVGANFDKMIRKAQQQHKEMTGKDLSYCEVTDRLLLTPPVVVVVDTKKKKGGIMGMGML